MDQIEALVQDVPGWSPVDQLYTLFQLAYGSADLPGDMVEIGSWCGRSALVLGLAAQMTGQAKVHCIDLFPRKTDWTQNADGSYSFNVTIEGQQYAGYQRQTVWQEPFERDIAPVYAQGEALLDIFQRHVARHHLQDVVRPFKGDSDMFVRSAGDEFRCKLAFIDGDHSYEAVCRDIDNLAQRLAPGGWICFDDAFSCYEGVNRAIERRIIGSPDFELGQQMTRKLFVARKKH